MSAVSTQEPMTQLVNLNTTTECQIEVAFEMSESMLGFQSLNNSLSTEQEPGKHIKASFTFECPEIGKCRFNVERIIIYRPNTSEVVANIAPANSFTAEKALRLWNQYIVNASDNISIIKQVVKIK